MLSVLLLPQHDERLLGADPPTLSACSGSPCQCLQHLHVELWAGLCLRATSFRLLLCTLHQAKGAQVSCEGSALGPAIPHVWGHTARCLGRQATALGGGSWWSRGLEERALNYKSLLCWRPLPRGPAALTGPVEGVWATGSRPQLTRLGARTTLTDQANDNKNQLVSDCLLHSRHYVNMVDCLI